MTQDKMYGFPISSVFFQICGFIFLLLILFFTFILDSLIVSIIVFFSILIFWYIFVFHFKQRFSTLRNKILQSMISLADLDGSEKILDLGTGAGYVAIGFSKVLNAGLVVGVDKFDQTTSILGRNFFEELKINFFGNTLNQAKKNAYIEKQSDKIMFVKSDLKHYFPFSDKSFHVLLSSQFLYCIPIKKREWVLSEINRVLKPEGKLIFFESKKYVNWNITQLEQYFNKLNYETKIHSLNYMNNKCIFYACKPK